MLLFLGLTLVWLISLWYYVAKVIPAKREIKACEHRTGYVAHAHTERFMDKAEFLHWHCADCPLQIPLHKLWSTRWDDVFFYGRDDRERYGEEHARVCNAQLEILLSK